MKKLIIPILLIIFSSFFLVNPSQVRGATCGGSCITLQDCNPNNLDVSKVVCPLCWPPNYNPNNANASTVCSKAGANCTCTAIPAEAVTNNTNMCNNTCSSDSECANDVNGCTVCWQTEIGSGFGGCESGVCTCIKEADKWKNERQIQNEKAATTTETPDLAAKVNTIVNYSTGIGGIIAFLLIVFGGFQIILSAGNPERVKAGKEMITSAIAGLLLIIFAVFILKLIGYDILKIPGFGK